MPITITDCQNETPLSISTEAVAIIGDAIRLRRKLREHFRAGKSPLPAAADALLEALDDFHAATDGIEY